MTVSGCASWSARPTPTPRKPLPNCGISPWGIHPPVLDRGLEAALSSLAETSAVPVRLTASAIAWPSPAIEAIAYFCAAELLANVAKHSSASHAAITVSDGPGKVLVTVTDDGTGGAHLAPAPGSPGCLNGCRRFMASWT